eukprot:m.28444 g.28444  ORF g.28444 m.28444 type:complete len:59 (+) comp8001_c0_seq1:784-960(+)
MVPLQKTPTTYNTSTVYLIQEAYVTGVVSLTCNCYKFPQWFQSSRKFFDILLREYSGF